jgi:3',5'-cyclic AMP phosphodiesterase CpdA
VAEENINAPLGRFGCDPPEEMVRVILKKIALLNPDVVLVPGDLVGHWVPPYFNTGPDRTYAILLRTLSKVQ